MKIDEANELRLVANEIMRKLYVTGERDQLIILRNYANSAIEYIDNKQADAAKDVAMTLTDKHVSDGLLYNLIRWYDSEIRLHNDRLGSHSRIDEETLICLLELKQRRAEDKAKTACK